MMTMKTLMTAALLAITTAAAGAPVSVASPDGRLVASLDTDNDGRALWSLMRDGHPLVAASRLGFILADAPKLERHLGVTGSERRSIDTSWQQPWGERRLVRDHHNELRVHLAESAGTHRRIDVIFRVSDDGIGFRYEFRDAGSVRIAEELTEFNIVPAATAWWIPAYDWNREEQLYRTTPIADVGTAQTPMTLRAADGTHVAIHEAALVDYAAMNLAHVDGGKFRVSLTPSNNGPKVVRTAPFATPWRALIVADSAAGLANSNLILNLNEPNKLGDVSWVRPCKYMGIWWGMHLGLQSWASGPIHGATTANALKMIDFAHDNGFCGLLIEGWNIGWDADWFADGESFDFTRPYPDFDLPRVAGYARAHGIRLIGHHETSGNIAHYETQMAAAFDLYQRLGIDAVKTGYVADAGGIKARQADGSIGYEWHEGQAMARHHLYVVTEAAKRHIAVNAHEPIKDTGLRRTYPNMVSREGARGMEYNAWGAPPNPPQHEATLAFTRMLAGPMDYTPGIVSLKGKNGQPIPSTLAKQLGLYIVLYSPLQMAADLPENYTAQPQALRFIKLVPVDWEDSIAIGGEVGAFAILARRDRNGPDWYVGAIGGASARNVSVPLRFLDPAKRYVAEIWRDGDKADWQGAPFDMVVETRHVRATDTLALRIAAGGGFAIRIRAE